MSTFLITGGSGFIGVHVIRIALQKGHKVIIFDQDPPPHRAVNGEIEFIKGDVRDFASLENLVRRADYIVHLAGILGTAETVPGPFPSIEVNIKAAIGLFNILRRINCPTVITVNGNYEWLNTYAITKEAAGRFALMYNKEFGTRIAVLRVYNAYGEYQKDRPVRKVVPEFIRSALFNEPIQVFGCGEQRFDLVYVGDVAQALYRAVTVHHDAYDRIMEVGSGQTITPLELAQKIIAMTKSKSSITFVPMRPGEPKVSKLCANLETLKPLRFRPMTPLGEGLLRTVEWYRHYFAKKQVIEQDE